MRISRFTGGLLLIGFCAGFSGAIVAAVPSTTVKVVVNANNAFASAPREEIARIFLKKNTTFSDGHPAMPVDLDEGSAVRKAFSREILGKDVAAVLAYWQEMIFSGRGTPPAQRTSDSDILDFVRSNPNGIGYVSAGADVGKGVKVVAVN
jgi:ABC-type phosphate transport system substrate-binding protein